MDLISRQAAIDAIDKHLRMTDVLVSYPGIISALTEWLNELPSAQPEPCEDAVSRKAVEEMLKNGFPARGMWEIEGDVVKQTVCETLADALMDLGKLPSAQPEPSQVARDIATIIENEKDMRVVLSQPEPQWIPVSERLPEENGLYLVTVNAQNRPVRIYEYAPWEMSEEREYWINDCDDHSHVFNHFVKAWMPLPEPYREEGD